MKPLTRRNCLEASIIHAAHQRSANPPAFACRTYATEDGPEGAPSVRQILEALTPKESS